MVQYITVTPTQCAYLPYIFGFIDRSSLLVEKTTFVLATIGLPRVLLMQRAIIAKINRE